MKKLLVLAVAVTLGLAVNASAQVEMKKKTEVKGDTTKTTTEVKSEATGAKAKKEVTTTGTETVTKTDVKGKNLKMEKETVDTKAGEAGKANIAVKKGAIEDLKIDWKYYMKDKDYIIEYTVNDKTNKNLMKELNLTPEQANAIAPGLHQIVSTSPFTAADIKNDVRAAVLKDLAGVAKAKAAPKAGK